jgi:hypothetical protein
MTPLDVLRGAAEGRDPETLIGPLFFLFTRLAAAGEAIPRTALADHLAVLAAHPGVDPELRLAAGALAIEHRGCWTRDVPAYAEGA